MTRKKKKIGEILIEEIKVVGNIGYLAYVRTSSITPVPPHIFRTTWNNQLKCDLTNMQTFNNYVSKFKHGQKTCCPFFHSYENN